MARGVTLAQLLDDLRVEAKLSVAPVVNQQVRDSQVRRLQRTQQWLWEDFDWPHLVVERQMPVSAGQRYYSPPSDVKIDRIQWIQVFRDGAWAPMTPGIEPEHLTAFNSDLDQRSWPPRRWRIYEQEQIEIWPIADINATAATLDGYLKVVGIRNLAPLVQDSDRADLDDRLIVMFAAAQMLGASGAKDAQLVLDQAQRYYARIRSGLTPTRRFRMFDSGMQNWSRRPVITNYRPPITGG